MRLLLLPVLLLAMACGTEGPPGDDFTLTGEITSAEAGPRPELDDIQIARAESGTVSQGYPDEAGVFGFNELTSIALPNECRDEGETFVYYVRDTRFAPNSVVAEGGFPESLIGSQIEMRGTYFIPAFNDELGQPRCVPVADTVEIARP